MAAYMLLTRCFVDDGPLEFQSNHQLFKKKSRRQLEVNAIKTGTGREK